MGVFIDWCLYPLNTNKWPHKIVLLRLRATIGKDFDPYSYCTRHCRVQSPRQWTQLYLLYTSADARSMHYFSRSKYWPTSVETMMLNDYYRSVLNNLYRYFFFFFGWMASFYNNIVVGSMYPRYVLLSTCWIKMRYLELDIIHKYATYYAVLLRSSPAFHVFRKKAQIMERWRKLEVKNPMMCCHREWNRSNVMSWCSYTVFKCQKICTTSGNSAASFALTTPVVWWCGTRLHRVEPLNLILLSISV